ncbi:hypothetical protein IJ00_23510 [Calothrix sp. 336/3]|nr:hypothetical protein IJ00_23510 [Calothrix sp. 336/3]
MSGLFFKTKTVHEFLTSEKVQIQQPSLMLLNLFMGILFLLLTYYSLLPTPDFSVPLSPFL